jgi:hypothetical protein
MITKTATVLVAGMLAIPIAHAQMNSSPSSTAGGATGTTKAPDAPELVMEPAQRMRIKEYVVKQSVPRATVPAGIRVGATLPTDVELREVPADWGPTVSRYRYVHTDGGIYFVEPGSRRVVYDLN